MISAAATSAISRETLSGSGVMEFRRSMPRRRLLPPLHLLEAAEVRRRQPHGKVGVIVIIAPADDFAMIVEPGDHAAVAMGELHIDHGLLPGDGVVDQAQQAVAPLPRQ